MAHAKAHEGMRDEHANLHAHHAALSELHDKAGQKDFAQLHHGMAGHHLKLAEHHATLADALAATPTEATKPTPVKPVAHHAKGGASLAKGAANQLHRKGLIDGKTHARIHREAGKARPFGALGGAGHYMGDVDAENSGGTNSVP